jgi:phage minor structural protein
MLIITDIYGNTEALSGYKGFKRFRSISGERTISFTITPTDQNAHSFDMVQEESIVEFKGEEYRIKQMNEKSKGEKSIKSVVAIHTFFDLIDEHVYDTYTGSMTLEAALQFVLGGFGYTWDIVDTFYAQDFEDFGDSNPVDLYNELRKRYAFEYTRLDTHLILKKRIGNKTDFQLRYKYNIKEIERQINSNNFSTYIRGYGKDGLIVEYISPLDKARGGPFKRKHAKPVRDDRYTTTEGLMERLKLEIKEVPDLAIPVNFVDMRRAGYPFDVPNEGDDFFLIYEPMKLDLEVRLIDITEEYEEFIDNPVRTTVTAGNFRRSMTDKFIDFSRTQKQVDSVITPDGKVRYDSLAEQVKRSTAALLSAQTELEFINGIISRSKIDPNHLTKLNSAGFGISKDNGNTFTEAITVNGFNLSVGAVGKLNANNIQVGQETTFDEGYDPIAIKSDLENALLEVAGNVEALGTYVDGSFEDGVISQAEAKAIEKYLNQINSEKSDIDSRYIAIYGAPELDDTDQKIALDTALVDFNTEHTALVDSINTAIADGKTTAAEKTDVDSKFTSYRTKLGELSTAFENAVNKIAQVKAENTGQAVRNDLRMTASLPTSISMGADGIRASTSDPTKYAQMDYRGFFTKKGAFAVERPDGFLSINDGIIQHGFAIQGAYPPMRTAGIQEEGPWLSTLSASRYENIQMYTFKHESRYLVARVGLKTASTNYSHIYFDLDTSDGNDGSSAVMIGDAVMTGGYNYWITEIMMDLGVPTGNLKVVYVRLTTSNTAMRAFGRILSMRLEG